MADKKDPRPRISSPELIAYLEELAKTGIYGKNAAAVASHIVRQEVMRLVERGVLRPIVFRDAPAVAPDADADETA